MPNRIVREGILTSERVNVLKPHAEVFYRRLMSVVDDFGRYFASPPLLRAACYPLRLNEVREADISRFLTEVEEAGLIVLYAVEGKRYLEMKDFRQQVRATKSRFEPPPPEGAKHPQRIRAADAQQPLASAHLDVSVSEGVSEGVSVSVGGASRRVAAPPGEPGKDPGRARPGCLDAVRAFWAAEHLHGDAEAFWLHFESNGWKVGGKAPMHDWRAAAKGWSRREEEHGKGNGRDRKPEKPAPKAGSIYSTSPYPGGEK